MIKTVKMGEHSYDMRSSAFTVFAYKNRTGRDLLEDLHALETIADSSEDDVSRINSVLQIGLDMAYVMICENDPKYKSFDEWTRELDGLFDDSTWIAEVSKLALSPFRRNA